MPIPRSFEPIDTKIRAALEKIKSNPRSRDAVKKYAFPVILFVFVIALSLMRINGSSVTAYNYYSFYGENYRDPNLLYGVPRGIRSDEWSVSTPWTLAQAQSGFPVHNQLYLAGQYFNQTDVPVASWTALFKPQYWAYFVLPLEQAFAFKWWFRGFLLAVAVYLLGIRLVGKHYFILSLASLAFVLSPFFQWWYSNFAIEIPAYAIFTFLCFLAIMDDAKRALFRPLPFVLFVFFAACFIFPLYPPFQIPLVIFLALAGIGHVLSSVQQAGTKNLLRAALGLLICFLCVGAILGLYYVTNRQGIQAMLNTVYPGARQQFGADPTFFIKLMGGFFNIQLQNDTQFIPEVLYNQSEAASFFYLSLFLLPFYVFLVGRDIRQRQPLDYLVVMSLLALLIFLVWGFIGLPDGIAKILLLNYVSPTRTQLAMGLINYILILIYLYVFTIPNTRAYKIAAGLYSAAVFLAVAGSGCYMENRWPGFPGGPRLMIFLIAFIVGCLVYLLLNQRKKLFFSILLLFTLGSSLYVNPLYRGLSPLRNAELVAAIKGVENPQAAWLTFNNNGLANYLAANGVKVLNGTYYSPNLAFWSQFDPSGQYLEVYNRYAHILATPITDPDKIEFNLFTADTIEIKISPCNPLLARLGVDYFTFKSPPVGYACLSPVESLKYTGLSIYIYARNKE